MQTKTIFLCFVLIILLAHPSGAEEKKPLSTPFGPIMPAFTPTSTATVPATVTPATPSPPPPPSEEEVTSPEEQTQPLSEKETAAPKESLPVTSLSPDEIVFNFDNADINEVINTISELLGINYVSDPRVTGVVNIHTKGKLSKKDLFAVLETLLKINNFTIVKKGELYHIIPLTSVGQEYVPPQLGLDKDKLSISDTLVMQIIPLKYVAAEEMANILKPLLNQGGQAITKDNLLILVDFSSNLKKILTLVDLFDVDIFERLHIKLYEIKNADAGELAVDIESIFQAFKIPTDNARAGGVTVLPIARLNMLMAVSANEQHLEKALEWAKKLDSEVSETELKIFVYFVQNGKAVDLSNVLNQVFLGVAPLQPTQFQSQLRETRATTWQMQPRAQQQQQTQRQQQQLQQRQSQLGQTQTPLQQQQQQQQQTLGQARRFGQAGAGQQYGLTRSVLTGEAQIVVDESTNALIIQATERDYRVIEKTLKKLDVYPKQVLIEVLIAEIRLDDELKMGIEWEYMNEISGGTYSVAASGVTTLAEEITSGLKYMVDKTGRFKSTLQAFAAKDKVNILSSPHIIASDNKEATINITEEIPIVSGSVTTTTAEPVITETTEYRDTGIILTVTPHINDKGLVTLDISQEVSEQSQRAATGSTNPIFLKRSAQTTMVVQNGQSVIIGGLIKETVSRGKSGIPVLSRIPLVGVLFGFHRNTVNRSELMLLLTPYVITSIEEADQITKEFQDKLSIIEKQSAGEPDNTAEEN